MCRGDKWHALEQGMLFQMVQQPVSSIHQDGLLCPFWQLHLSPSPTALQREAQHAALHGSELPITLKVWAVAPLFHEHRRSRARPEAFNAHLKWRCRSGTASITVILIHIVRRCVFVDAESTQLRGSALGVKVSILTPTYNLRQPFPRPFWSVEREKVRASLTYPCALVGLSSHPGLSLPRLIRLSAFQRSIQRKGRFQGLRHSSC